MKRVIAILVVILTLHVQASHGQERVGPVIKDFGLIYPIPRATVTPDTETNYKIVVDLLGAAESSKQLNPALNNVARMLNLHVTGGADPEKMDVVLAVHGPATPSLMSDTAYEDKYGVPNPNTGLLDALHSAGVVITVCGQSMISRGVPANSLNEHVQVYPSKNIYILLLLLFIELL